MRGAHFSVLHPIIVSLVDGFPTFSSGRRDFGETKLLTSLRKFVKVS